MAKARRKRRTVRLSPLHREAQQDAFIRYNPEASALRALVRDAQDTLVSGKLAEEGAARGIRAAVKAAWPEVRDSYQRANATMTQARADMDADLSKIGAAADPYKAISAREFAGAQRRVAEALAGAEREFAERAVAAESGRAYAVRSLEARAAADIAKVRTRQTDLAREKGAFAASSVAKQREARRERASKARLERARQRGQDRRNRESIRSRERVAAEKNRVTVRGQNISAAKGGGSKKRAKPTEGARNKWLDVTRSADRIRRGSQQSKPATLHRAKVRLFNEGRPKVAVDAAAELAKYNKLRRSTYSGLREIGTYVPPRYRRSFYPEQTRDRRPN